MKTFSWSNFKHVCVAQWQSEYVNPLWLKLLLMFYSELCKILNALCWRAEIQENAFLPWKMIQFSWTAMGFHHTFPKADFLTSFWTFCPSKPLQALRICFLYVSSDLKIKCHFIPQWWASNHCLPCCSSSPAPKAVLHQPPPSAMQMKFCVILAVEAMGFSPALPGRSVCKESPSLWKEGDNWAPGKEVWKRVEAGLVLLISFLVWFLLIQQVFYDNFPLLCLLLDMESEYSL